MAVKITRRVPSAPTTVTKNILAAAARWPTASRDQHNDWSRASSSIAHHANDDVATPKLEKLYSLREVASHWNISLSTLYREIEDGKLMAKKVRGQWRVPESAAADYSQTHEERLPLPGHQRTRRNDT
jgi:excisionase family DNA binding protein